MPFSAAAADLARRGLMPTTLSSAQLEALDARIRSQAFFSARVANTRILDGMRSRMVRLASGQSTGAGDYSNPATVRTELKALLAELDYRPEDPRMEGTIQDLRTDARLNLIVRTNEEMATGYGQFLQSTDPDIIDSWPAWELVRVADRRVPRYWSVRWLDAAGRVGDDDAAAMLRRHGRMLARKDSPIWTALSRFGSPQPPFDFNSGMGVADVDRDTALDLGLIREADRITQPVHPGIEPMASVEDLSTDLRAALEESLDPGYRIDPDGVLRGPEEPA